MMSVEQIKKTYTPGTRVVCDYCADDIHPIASGEQGTVKLVDDMGTVHIIWDCKRSFGLIVGEDTFHIL